MTDVNGNDYTCANCGKPSGMMGHSIYPNGWSCVADPAIERSRAIAHAERAVVEAAERSADWPAKQDCDYSAIQRDLESAVRALRQARGQG